MKQQTTNNRQMKHSKIKTGAILGILSVGLLLTSCDPTTPDDHHEEEVITTLQVIANDGSNTFTFIWSDPDGDGGNAPSIDTVQLAASTNYTVNLHVLNESETPTDTVTAEILSEGAEHQFFFQPTGANITTAYGDTDGTHPIGLLSTWTVGTASTGTIVITLRHEPNKSAPNVSSGDITNAGGETDIEVTFPVVIQ